jgi:hypothetical protein
MKPAPNPYEYTREGEELTYTFSNKDGIQYKIIFEPMLEEGEEPSDTPMYHYRVFRISHVDGKKIFDQRIIDTIIHLNDVAWKDANGKITSLLCYHCDPPPPDDTVYGNFNDMANFDE